MWLSTQRVVWTCYASDISSLTKHHFIDAGEPMNEPKTDLESLNIEKLDVRMVSDIQIIEHIRRHKLHLNDLVNEILLANGYQTRIAPFGEDGSFEILALGKLDPFGFELPRITVMVKLGTDRSDPSLTELERFL